MPHYIVKPKQDEDFYVDFSTIVDAPCVWGSWDEMVAAGYAAERLERARLTGSSCAALRDDGKPWFFGWDKPTLMVGEGIEDETRPEGVMSGDLQRVDVRAFCESFRDGKFHPPAGMVRWLIGE